MTEPDAPRALARAGFLLVLLALLTGLAVPAFYNSRMAVAAHMSGILDGLLLVEASVVWPRLVLSARQATLARRLILVGAYANWSVGLLAAAWGTTRNTPHGGAGFGALPWQELTVHVVQVAMAIIFLSALTLVVFGLRPLARTGDRP